MLRLSPSHNLTLELITSRKRNVKNVQELKVSAESANLFYTKNPWNQRGVEKT